MDKKNILVSSFSIGQDIIQSIAGNKFQVISIIPNNSDIHSYELKPSDIQNINNNIVFVNGLNLESQNFMEIVHKYSKKVVVLSEGINKKYYKNNYVDPHAWLSIKNIIIYAYNVYALLANEYPEHANYFYQNYTKYKEELQKLSLKFKDLNNKKFCIIKDDFSNYFADEYNINIISVHPEWKKDISINDFYKTIRKCKEMKIQKLIGIYGVENSLLVRVKEELLNQNINSELSENLLYSDGLVDYKKCNCISCCDFLNNENVKIKEKINKNYSCNNENSISHNIVQTNSEFNEQNNNKVDDKTDYISSKYIITMMHNYNIFYYM